MSVSTKNLFENVRAERSAPTNPLTSLLNSYKAYAERQVERSMLWYLQVIIVIPCVVMVISIFLMAMATDNYIWFVGLSMLLFFTNVIAFIAEAESTFYVPLYHATILILMLIPIITNLLQL